ncbi:DUF6415 family natural product biosynthesis protein [Streptomyces sp. ME02-6987-2C]|uniref:DUF6415 family natural product biosynthesis protein n=1 Tax=unclassified Streptomyces TaxID=2593676 RepID=UPI0029B00094|nr:MULTISPECIES: DUF6415 family natural product biosynthesis protein [unclassified Streptomyces]MDX3366500.1 DUF6415 family natural product biosynthesis protein [Streptomyces sp. ME02-6987-2C]MDX3424585.1 DUF6415 family natural product biosynthesis protein [Streptomyces sp. ME02-6985-2c]
MRLSLDPRREGSQLVGGPGRQAHVTDAPARERDHVVAALETVTLVLGEDSPLPESAADVEDLVCLLRGHIAQLGASTAPDVPALLRAQQLCSESIPMGYVASRVHLVRLAEATQELTAYVEHGGPGPNSKERERRWPRPTVNVLRGTVFALALACLIFAASVPRT